MDTSLLQNRDYTIIIAKTATLPKEPPGYEHWWQDAYESIINLVRACQKFDTDGVTLYVACQNSKKNCFEQYKQVMAEQLREIIEEHYPPHQLDLSGVLKNVLDDYFVRKAAKQAKENGEIIIVLIDGEPCNRMDVAKTIVEVTKKLANDSELGIGFVQIGEDLLARGFLKALDNDLKLAGAKFDIVETTTIEQIEVGYTLQFMSDVINV